MEITSYTTLQGRHIFLVKGLVKEQAFSEIRQALTTAPADSVKELWIDCSHVDRPRLTNSSICSFVSELLKVRKQGTNVMLCGMNSTTERLFQLLRLDTLFQKARSFDEVAPEGQATTVAA